MGIDSTRGVRAGVLALVALIVSGQARAAGTLYFSQIFNPTLSDGGMARGSTAGGAFTPLADVGGGLRGAAVDATNGKLYWTDVDNDEIVRADLDGGNPVAIVTNADILMQFPLRIVVDPAGGKIYWGDSSTPGIYRANLDGSNPALWIATNFAGGLFIDLDHGKLYWTSLDGVGTTRVIERANLNGSLPENLVAGEEPADVAVDPAGGKVYWTDFVGDAVKRSNLNGSNVETLYPVGANLNPGGIALDVANGKVYWGQNVSGPNPYVGKIMRMDLDGANPVDVISDPDIGSIGSLVLAAPEPASAACAISALAAVAALRARKSGVQAASTLRARSNEGSAGTRWRARTW
jgi:DNA-binding beta-propeller fold protein YncE